MSFEGEFFDYETEAVLITDDEIAEFGLTCNLQVEMLDIEATPVTYVTDNMEDDHDLSTTPTTKEWNEHEWYKDEDAIAGIRRFAYLHPSNLHVKRRRTAYKLSDDDEDDEEEQEEAPEYNLWNAENCTPGESVDLALMLGHLLLKEGIVVSTVHTLPPKQSLIHSRRVQVCLIVSLGALAVLGVYLSGNLTSKNNSIVPLVSEAELSVPSQVPSIVPTQVVSASYVGAVVVMNQDFKRTGVSSQFKTDEIALFEQSVVQWLTSTNVGIESISGNNLVTRATLLSQIVSDVSNQGRISYLRGSFLRQGDTSVYTLSIEYMITWTSTEREELQDVDILLQEYTSSDENLSMLFSLMANTGIFVDEGGIGIPQVRLLNLPSSYPTQIVDKGKWNQFC